MARQLDLLASGQIIPTALHQEMERSYLEYAMSVIVGRALPDVRDGLKPVHRRILYAMYELGLTPDRPYRKCARVVGDVLGKYHPHGDQAVYDALVRMVQDFSSRYPLLGGHGNFGSVDNDPPAAMRYTETRLASIAYQGVLQNISEAIVDFTSNFDNSQQEPVVLPAQLPILLLNGCTGIAVGMATNIPPHNLAEVVDGLIALIDRPELPDEELWKIIPGPDFPTGGQILDSSGIFEAYRTGKGIIPIRGVTQIEKISLEGRRPKERTAIVVTELPYQVNKSAWIEKVADLVNQGRLEGIADIRDESDRQGIRVVIELKRETEVQRILQELYKQTALQVNFGAILLALVDNKPCQLSLRSLLEEFLKFREETLTRQYNNELGQAENRLHLLEGLLIALNNIDAVIEILKNAADGTTAKLTFQRELDLSDAQSDSILAMPMRRLTGLERQKLQTEYQELQQRITQLQTLLRDRKELMKCLKKELRSLKKQFGDTRRTRIISTSPPKPSQGEKSKPIEEKAKDKKVKPKPETKVIEKSSQSTPDSLSPTLTLFTPQTPPENGILTLTYQGQIYWRSPESSPPTKPLADFVIYQETIQGREQLIVISDQGKAYPLPVAEIPPENSQSFSLLSLLPKPAQREGEKSKLCFLMPAKAEDFQLILLTQQGRIKRMPLSELNPLGNRGLSVIKLKEGDELSYVCLREHQPELAIGTSGGRILRFNLNDAQFPLMGRNHQANQGLRLRQEEKFAGCTPINSNDNLILISQLGYGKQLPIKTLRLTQLGDIGTHALQFINKMDNLAGMIVAYPGENVILVTNHQRQLVVQVDGIKFSGKDGTGETLVKLKSEEMILTVARQL